MAETDTKTMNDIIIITYYVIIYFNANFFRGKDYHGIWIYLVLILILEERFGENVDEFSEVLKVLGHLGGQHHIDDTLPNDFVAFSVHSYARTKVFWN